MSQTQTVLNLIQAMLQGLVQELQANDAAVVLPGGAAAQPHILARVGRLELSEWHSLLHDSPPDLLKTPLPAHAMDEQPAHLCVYKAGKQEWGRASRLATSALATAVDYLLTSTGNDFNWMQLVASRRLLSVAEEELRRIVLDIHDGPVQKLFAANNLMIHARATVERKMRAGEPYDASHLLPDMIRIIDMLEASQAEIRQFLGAFQTEEMSQRDVVEVLEALVMQHEQLTQMQVHFEAPTLHVTIPTPVKIALYRILQEALTNAYRHAGVTEVYVRLWAKAGDLHMEIVDFGKGFDPPTMLGPGATEDFRHIGLRGMRDRVHLVAGSFEVHSRAGQGTRIQVSVPTE